MTKTQSKYWGIQYQQRICFTGTFTECWDKLVADFGKHTLAELDQQGIKITRVK